MLNSALLLLCLIAPTAPAAASPSPTAHTDTNAALRTVAWADEPRVRAPAVAVVVASRDTGELRDPFGVRRRSAAVAAPKAESLRDPFGPRRPAAAPSPASRSQPLRDPFG